MFNNFNCTGNGSRSIFGMLRKNKRNLLLAFLCAVLSFCAIFAFSLMAVNSFANAEEPSPQAGSADVVSYRISGTCAQMEAGWVAAVKRSVDSKSQVKIILGNDWNAATHADFKTALGTTNGYFSYGAIYIDTGMDIIVDLNGYKINRGLSASNWYINGRVIYAHNGKLTIEDSSEAKSGAITGGATGDGVSNNSSNGNGAGIYVAYATVIFNSGNITGNVAKLGGGVGNSVTNGGYFIMNGGYVSGNKAVIGGGLHGYMNVELHGGVVSENTGNGIYVDTTCRFKMTGGSVINNSGSGIVVHVGNSDMTMSGGTISGNSGWGIHVSNDKTATSPTFGMTISGGSITNNAAGGIRTLRTAQYKFSGSPKIYNNGDAGNLVMANATDTVPVISGKLTAGTYIGVTGYPTSPTAQAFATGYTAAGNAAADVSRYFFADNKSYTVKLNSDGTLQLATGGTTSSLASAWTTAVNSNGTFKMTQNWTAVTNATFGTSFNGASDTVTTNTTPFANGALNVPSGKTVTLDLNGFTLDRALTTAKNNGRAIIVWGTLVIKDSSGNNGGTITGAYNTASGGIEATNGGKITFQSGTISGNIATSGGGVQVSAGGTFTMSGGVIRNNIATDNGGGVRVAGTFTMTGGEITQNTATYNSSSGNGGLGGGVYYENGTLTVSNTAKIHDNFTTTSVATSNVYLPSGKTITIGGALNSGFNVGVTMAAKTGTFTTGYGTANSAKNPWDYFTSDNGSYEVSSTGSGTSKQATLGLLIDVPSTPAGLTFNGSVQEIVSNYNTQYIASYTISATYETGTTKTITVTTPTVDGMFIKARDAADYRITFKLKSGYSWKTTKTAADVTITATINKKTITAASTAANKVYDGTTAATVTVGTITGNSDGANLTVTATGTFADKNVGTNKNVTVAYTLGGSKATNYTMANKTVKASITAKTITGLAWANDDLTYTGTAQKPTATVGTAQGLCAGDTAFSATVTGEQTNASATAYTATATALANSNYVLPAAGTAFLSHTFTIKKAEISVNWSTAAITYSGSAQNPTVTGVNIPATVTGGTKPAAANFVYTITAGGTNAGTANTVKATLASAFTGNFKLVATGSDGVDAAGESVTKNYEIKKAQLTVTVTPNAWVYDMAPHNMIADGYDAKTVDNKTPTFGGGAAVWRYATSTDNGSTWSSWSTTMPQLTNVADGSTKIKVQVEADNHEIYESAVLSVVITPADITSSSITQLAPVTYTGEPQPLTVSGDRKLAISITFANGRTENLVLDKDYEVTYSNTNGGSGDRTNAGTVTVTLRGKGNYDATKTTTTTFVINKAKINLLSWTSPADLHYSGTAKDWTAAAVSTANNIASTYLPVAGTDFTYIYAPVDAGLALVGGKAVNAGNYTVTAELKAGSAYANNFEWDTSVSNVNTRAFKVNKAVINAGDITWDNLKQNYTGTALHPTINMGSVGYATAVDSAAQLTANDFEYTTQTNAGANQSITATLKEGVAKNFTFSAADEGSASITTHDFEIAAAAITLSITDLAALAYIGVYDGEKHGAMKNYLDKVVLKHTRDESSVKWYFTYDNLGTGTEVWSNTLPEVTNVSDSRTLHFKVEADNHTPYIGSTDIKITPKDVTVTANSIAVTGKTYDGNANVAHADVDVSGVQFSWYHSGDELGIEFTNATYADRNAATGKTVTVSGISLVGADAGNYNLTDTVAISTATITPLKVVIEWYHDQIDDAHKGLDASYEKGVEHVALAVIANKKNAADTDRLDVSFVTAGTVAIDKADYPVRVNSEITNASGNYTLEGVDLSAVLKVKGSGFLIYREEDPEISKLVYDGTEKLPVLYYTDNDGKKVYLTTAAYESYTVVSTDGAEVVGGKSINAGAYRATIELSQTYDWSGSISGSADSLVRSFPYTIEKATVAGLAVKGEDGVTANGGNVFTATYTKGKVQVLGADWSNITVNGTALANLSEDVKNAFFNSDGSVKGIEAVVYYDGTTAQRENANESGYAVEVRFNVNGNFNAISSLSATLIILRSEIDISGAAFQGDGFTGLTTAYDGSFKKVKVVGLPEGVTANITYYLGTESKGTDGVQAIGNYTVRATFNYDSANYKLVNTAGGNEITVIDDALKITAKGIDLSGVQLVGDTTGTGGITYDGSVHKVIAANVPDGVTGVEYVYKKNGEELAAEGVKDAGEYTVEITFKVDPNYGDDVTAHAEIRINPAPLTITANDVTVSYGDAPTDNGATFTGLVSGDGASLFTLAYEYKNKQGGNYDFYAGVGEYVVEVRVASSSTDNYTITSEAGRLNVKKREIKVSWQNSSTDGNTSFEYVYSGSEFKPYARVTNAVNGDVLTLVISGGQTNAALNCVAKVVGITGLKADNYALPVVDLTQTFNVLPKPRTGVIVWDESEYYYNGQAQAPKAYYFENETDRVPKELTVTTNVSAVGVGRYTATASLGTNYDLKGETTKEFEIKARKIFIEIDDASVKFSNDIDLSVLTWSYVTGSDEFVSGDAYTISFDCGSITAKGKYAIVGKFTSNNAKNYEVSFVGSWISQDDKNGKCGTLTVTEGTYDVNGITFTGTEVTYDGQPHGITVKGLPEGVEVASITYVKDGKIYAAEDVIKVGEYTVEITYKSTNPNFTALTGATATLTIKKAALTVKANDNTITYGDEPVSAGVSYSGWVNGESEALNGIISGALQYVYTYAKYGNVGSYRIDVVEGCILSENYEITLIPGTLTVVARELSVEWFKDDNHNADELKYIYDESNPAKEYAPVAVIMGGVVNGDSVNVTVKGAQSKIGVNYTATAVTDNANYVVRAADATVKFSVIPSAKYTVIWDNSEITYNKSEHKPAAIYFDEAGNQHAVDPENVIITSGDGVNAGSHVVSIKAGTTAQDGKPLTWEAFGYEILPAKVTVQIAPATSTVEYGKVLAWKDALGSSDWTVTSGTVYGGDSLQLTFKVAADNSSGVGVYAVTAESGNNNYSVTFIDGTVTVEKAEVVMNAAVTGAFGTTPVVHTAGYNGATHEVKISGELPAGITGVSYEYYLGGKLISSYGVKNAGEYTVKAIFTTDGNHKVTGEYTATLKITAKAVGSITLPATKTLTYDGLAHALLLSGDSEAVKEVKFTYTGAKYGAVTEAVNADVYTVTAVISFNENYDASGLAGYNAATGEVTLTGTLTINKATLTVKANDGSAEYGEAAKTYGYEITGFVGGESAADESVIKVTNVTYGFNTGKNVAGTDAGEYKNEITVTLSYTSNNYEVAYATVGGTYTVTPKTISSADVTWYDKEGGTAGVEFTYNYDNGKTFLPVAVYKDSGITLVVSGAQSVAGDNYTAKVVDITGANAKNYALPVVDIKVSFSITNEPVVEYEVIWDNVTHVYDNTEYKPTAYYYDGNAKVEISAGDITVSGGSAINAGTYTASVNANLNGKTLTNTSVAFTISKRSVYIRISDASSRYGETPNMSAVSWKYEYANDAERQFLAGEKYTITFTCEATSSSSVGKYAISGHFVSGNAKNYDVIFVGSYVSASAAENGKFGTLTIDKAVYDMTKVTFVGVEVTYDGLAHGVTLSGLPVGLTADNYECTYASASGWSVAGAVNAGVYNVTVTFKGLDTENYEPVEPLTTTLTIKKASLVITANDHTVTYGDAASANGVSYVGFATANGVTETESVLKGQLTFAYSYTKGDSAGSYRITPSGLSSDNYEITFRAGTLTVDKKTVTVKWYYDSTRGDQPLEYRYDNGKPFAPVAVAEGLLAGDSAEITVSGAQGAVGVNITATASAISNPNYKLPADGSEKTTFSILPTRDNYVIWDNTRFVYDATSHKPTAFYIDANGVQQPIPADKISVDGGEAIDAKEGYYLAAIDEVYYNSLNLAGDRQFRFYVDPLEIEIEILGQTATYGKVSGAAQNAWKYAGANKFLAGVNQPIPAGSTLEYLNFFAEVGNQTPIGEYAITLVCGSGNYRVTYVRGTLTITKATVQMTEAVTGVFDNGTTASAANTHNYNGQTFKVEITGELPKGITNVRYEYYQNGKLVSANGVREAGEYTVRAIFTVDGNYNEITEEYTAILKITQAEIDISGVTFDANKTLVYNGGQQPVFVMGDAIGVERVDYDYYEYSESATDHRGAKLNGYPQNVGKYVVIAKFVAAENYTANGAQKEMVLEITRAELTVVITNKTTVYGTAAPALGANDYTVSGLLGADDKSVIGSLSLSYENYGGASADAKAYVISASEGAAFNVANYSVKVINGTLTVTKYFINANEVKWYDDNSGANLQTYIYSYDGSAHTPYAVAIINGQTVELTVAVSGGDGVSVGSYLATVTGASGNANYEVAADINCAFVIMQQPPVNYEVVWTNTQFVYDGQPHVPTASYFDGTSIVTVDPVDVTISDGKGGTAAINAGEYTATVTVEGNTVSVTFTVSPKKVSVIIGEVQTVYGTAPDLSNVSFDCDGADRANVEADIRFVCTVPVTANVGTYANAIEGYYPAGGNYEVIFTNGALRISKARLDTSGIEFEDATVTYDGKKHAVTPTSLPAGLSAHVSYYTSDSGWSYDIDGVSAAGVYTVTVVLVLDESIAGNYEPVTGMTGTLTINRAVLTVTAKSNAITYGEAPAAHADGVTITGFVNGEGVSVLKGKLDYAFNYNIGGSVGTYSITPSGLHADNYEVKFVSGVLTVNKRVVTISWYKDSSLSESGEFRYTYDGATEFKPHAVAGNLYGNDSASLTVSGGQINAGLKYLATVTKISNNNYALPSDGSQSVSFDILPRSNVIVWENTEFIYNGLRQAPGAYYFDADGKQQPLTVTVNGYPQQAGEYVATATAPAGVTLTGDTTRKFVIKPREITIEILSVTETYKRLPQFDQSGWRYVGDATITDGNYISLICPITSMIDPDAGTYPITGVCTSSNYKVTWINGTYTIVRQEIPVPAPASKAYTGATLVADLEHSDMYSVIQNLGGVAVGKYAVTFALNAAYARNYKWAGTEEYYITVDFEITRAVNEFTKPFEMNWTVDTADTTLGKNEPEAAFGTPVITFYYDEGCTRVAEESYILGSATPGMTFWVKVTVDGTENYTGLEFKHSILIVGDRALALNWETFSAVYDGREHAPRAYVNIEGRKVYLKVTVDRKAVHAGEYTATAIFEAEDGTSLEGYKLHEGAPSADKEIRFTISPCEVRVEIGDILDRVYGTPFVNADMLLSKNVYGTVVAGDNLGIKFTTEFTEVNGYVPVGKYAITGSWNNTDYNVIFFGNWEGDEFHKAQTAGVYSVIPADITVKKSGSEWFDQDDVYDKNQPSLVSLAKRNDDDTEYVNISLKGDKSAKATITYSFLYEYDDGKVMTDEMIKSFIVEGNTAVPEIRQAGDWVIYYRITEQNHNVKYGQWVVRIRKNTEFIVVSFKKAFTTQYGDTVFGTDLMPQLIDTEGNSEYLELGNGLEGITLLQLRKIARAYAYEDVTSNMGFVGSSTAAGKYCIRFVIRDEYAEEYDGVEFKYSDSNDKADTNLDKYEVTRRELTLEWGETSFVYDGAGHVPTATLKGLVGGEAVELNNIVLGEANTLQLKNGDVMNVTVSLYQGANTSSAGAFILRAEIDNANYELKLGSIVTVNVAKRALEIVWGETSFNYDGASHIPTATIKGFAGGEEITLNDIVIGEVREITLSSGEVVKIRVTLISGSDTTNGNYGLRVEVVDSGDYELQNGSVITVTITDNSKVALPNWAIYAIAGAAAFAVLLIIILIAVLKKRKKAQHAAEGLIDEDGFMDDYEG